MNDFTSISLIVSPSTSPPSPLPPSPSPPSYLDGENNTNKKSVNGFVCVWVDGGRGERMGERAPYNIIIWLVVYTVQLSASNLKFNV